MGLKLKAKKHKRTLFSKSFRKVASKVALTLLFPVMGQESGTGIWLAPFLNLIPGS